MPKSRVIVEYPDRASYAVRIGGGLVPQVGADLRAAGIQSERCLVVCDSDSATRCLPALKAALAAAAFRVADITVPAVDPADAWDCMGELLGAISQLNLPEDAPVVVCAGVELAELAAFAFSLEGAQRALVLIPASLAAVLRTVGTDAFTVDAGFANPLSVKAAPSFACIEPGFLACASDEEADLGLYELEQAATYCDAEFSSWLSDALGDIAAYDEDACVLALIQTLASRADAIGAQLRA